MKKLFALPLIACFIFPSFVLAQDEYMESQEAVNQEYVEETVDADMEERALALQMEVLSQKMAALETKVDSVQVQETTPAAEVVKEVVDQEESKTLLEDLFKDYDIPAPTGSVTADYYSRYVWRGQYLDRDAVFQPGVSLSAAGLTVGYWANFDMENEIDSRTGTALQSDESDYYVAYSYTYETLTLTAGHTWYDFPEQATSSKELYFSLGVAAPFSPVFSFYHDYEDGKDLNTDGTGNYYSLALAHSFDLQTPYGISLDVGTTLGYVDGQWLSGTGYHFTPTATLKIPLTKNASVMPTIGYNVPMKDLKDSNIGNQEKKFFGGVKTAVTF